MQFRQATIDDLPLIVAIYNSTVAGRMVTADTKEVTVEERVTWFHKHSPDRRPLMMVEHETEVFGWISFGDFYGRPAYNGTAELSIYLHENARGKGFGKSILNDCIQLAPRLQISTILGFIFAHNEPSIRLFLNAGFEEWANLKEIAEMDGNNYSLKIFGKRVSL